MNIRFTIKWDLGKEKTLKQAKMVLFDSMVKLHELAVINAPVDIGRLRNSIRIYPATPGFSNYVLTDGVEYGVEVEFGTSPHVVSAKHLKDWARRVLGDEDAAYAVAKKITKEGTEAQPFFRPALDQVKNIWVGRFWEQNLAK